MSAVEDQQLAEAVGELSLLVPGSLSLVECLTKVAELAERAVPGADGSAILLFHDQHLIAVAASSELAGAVEEVQTRLNEGPGLNAAEAEQPLVSGSLGGDLRWRRFGGRVARMHVHSVLALPLLTAGTVIGAIDLYGRSKNAFDQRAIDAATRFAARAAGVVQSAQALADAQEMTRRLQAALSTRAVIDQAVGIIMARTRTSPEQAFERLRHISQTEHRKVREVAQRLVDQASKPS